LEKFTEKKVITRKAEQILEILGNLERVKDFYLAGGTALALQIGHRISEDFDFFTIKSFDSDIFFKFLLNNFKEKIKKTKSDQGMLYININNISTSFIEFKYPLLQKKMQVFKGIRIAGIKDIGAMKISAITGRGAKRDFIDLYFLFKLGYSLKELIYFYYQKFNSNTENNTLLYKSLLYFNDADEEETPVIFESVTWETIKKEIKKEVLNTFKRKII